MTKKAVIIGIITAACILPLVCAIAFSETSTPVEAQSHATLHHFSRHQPIYNPISGKVKNMKSMPRETEINAPKTDSVSENAPTISYNGTEYQFNVNVPNVPTEDDIILLAQLTYAEAGNQDETGQRYVIDVVLNRMEDEHCPDTIRDVIYQSGQFTTAYSVPYQPVIPEILQLVYEEIDYRVDYEVYYFNCGGYSSYGEPMFQHGAHYFCKRKGG